MQFGVCRICRMHRAIAFVRPHGIVEAFGVAFFFFFAWCAAVAIICTIAWMHGMFWFPNKCDVCALQFEWKLHDCVAYASLNVSADTVHINYRSFIPCGIYLFSGFLFCFHRKLIFQMGWSLIGTRSIAILHIISRNSNQSDSYHWMRRIYLNLWARNVHLGIQF